MEWETEEWLSSAYVGAFRNGKKRSLPVWFISIREPFVILSKSLMKLASKSVGEKRKQNGLMLSHPFQAALPNQVLPWRVGYLGFSQDLRGITGGEPEAVEKHWLANIWLIELLETVQLSYSTKK